MNSTIYCGLIEHIKKFAQEREYEVVYEPVVWDYTEDDVKNYVQKLRLPFELRDYQSNCFLHGINHQKALFISPTGSGKSVIIYLLTRYFAETRPDSKALIVVPTLNLISQMTSDFIEYDKNYGIYDMRIENHIHQIYSGQEKETERQITISTWQSLHRQPKNFFQDYGFVLVDECHLAKADSLKNILSNCTTAEWRFGTTGTLDGTKCHKFVIEGLTGPVYQATTTRQLMDNKQLASLEVKCVVLKYPEDACQLAKKFKYIDEIDFIINHEKRTKFICNLACSCKGNTLVLFQYVEKHGKNIYSLITDKLKDNNRKIFFVYGGTEMEIREQIRAITENETDAILVASVGVFSTGVNIKNLDNIIFASPSKSRIRTLQSIGRVLRIGRSDKAVLYDIVDDLQHKKHRNFVLKHFIERVQIYDSEKFKYTLHQLNI
jgi:superfamily II DNA or RNA helicase